MCMQSGSIVHNKGVINTHVGDKEAEYKKRARSHSLPIATRLKPPIAGHSHWLADRVITMPSREQGVGSN